MGLMLDYPLMIAVAVLVSVGIIYGVSWWKRRKSVGEIKPAVRMSRVNRFTSDPAYLRVLQKYRVGLRVLLGLVAVTALFSVMLVSKPVTVDDRNSTSFNRDIMLCLDVSGSMEEVNLQVVQEMKTFVKKFRGERIGMVVWNSYSYMLFPLTDDYDYVMNELSKAEDGVQNIISSDGTETNEGHDYFRYTVGDGEGGSLVGDGLAGCILTFGNEVDRNLINGEKSTVEENQEDKKPVRPKSIIFVTDNEVNGEQIITLTEATEYAKNAGVKVYGIQAHTDIVEQTLQDELQEAVESTGGEFYTLGDTSGVDNIVTKIMAEKPAASETKTVLQKEDTQTLWVLSILVVVAGILVLFRRFEL
jgi:Ca-activated chloride channel family protein